MNVRAASVRLVIAHGQAEKEVTRIVLDFPGTPDHFRLHIQAAHALDALDHRHVWLLLRVIGGRPAAAAELDEAVQEIDAWLAEIREFDFDAHGDDLERVRPTHEAFAGAARINVTAYKRGADFQSPELPLVGNPTPAAAYYS